MRLSVSVHKDKKCLAESYRNHLFQFWNLNPFLPCDILIDIDSWVDFFSSASASYRALDITYLSVEASQGLNKMKNYTKIGQS